MQIIHLVPYNYFIFLDSSLDPDHLSALQIWEYSMSDRLKPLLLLLLDLMSFTYSLRSLLALLLLYI